MITLKNQIAVVTGASSGIGRAIAAGLAVKGVKLCLLGRSVEKLRQLKEVLLQDSPRVEICKTDLTSEEDINTASSFVLQEYGAVDILVHSAGFLSFGPIEEAEPAGLDLHFKVNYFAPYQLTKSLLSALKEGRGQIVFLNSSAIQRAIPRLAQYSASKSALKAFADALREEVNPYGIRVLSIYPGQTATPMQRELYNKKGLDYNPEHLLQPDDIAEVVIHSLMVSNAAEITEIFIRPMQKGSD
jgi:short-subunit dehydrogenase